MTAPYVFTFADVLDHLNSFLNYGGIGAEQIVRREVARASYREVVGARDWSFLRSNARVPLRTPQTDGTVAYDHTGGTYERQLTLTGDTWPDWAVDASVRLGDPAIVCDIEEVKTSTVVTLDATMSPIADITSTTYSLYPRWYRLPNDFASMLRPMGEGSWELGEQVSKETIEQLNRYEDTTGAIEYYAVGSPLDLMGAMALYTHPPIDADETLDIPYVRRPRDIVYTGYNSADIAGTITVTADSATVTGASTSFEAGMVNSILRIGKSTTYPPGGLVSEYPYGEQRSIKSVASATSLTLDAEVATTRTAVKYRITDPIDLDVVLYDAYLRCCEKNMARMLRLKNLNEVDRAYREALLKAKEMDCRDIQPRVAGPSGRHDIARLTDSSNRTVVSF